MLHVFRADKNRGLQRNQSSKNGLIGSLLAPNDKRKDANALNLDGTNPKRNN
ncbi:hypothetical protein HpBGD34_12800 [Helicobacter pylori]